MRNDASPPGRHSHFLKDRIAEAQRSSNAQRPRHRLLNPGKHAQPVSYASHSQHRKGDPREQSHRAPRMIVGGEMRVRLRGRICHREPGLCNRIFNVGPWVMLRIRRNHNLPRHKPHIGIGYAIDLFNRPRHAPRAPGAIHAIHCKFATLHSTQYICLCTGYVSTHRVAGCLRMRGILVVLQPPMHLRWHLCIVDVIFCR